MKRGRKRGMEGGYRKKGGKKGKAMIFKRRK